MQKLILLILFIISSVLLRAQNQNYNLINNWSFEDSVKCPFAHGQIEYAKYWISPIPNYLLPADYFNGNCIGNQSTPNSICGYQIPKTGICFAGFYGIPFMKTQKNVREYIETKFANNLQINKYYYIRFYVNLADKSEYAISSIGAHISDTLIHENSYDVLPLFTQIKNTEENKLTDTVNWVKISGIYKAHGGEQYITIGNFKTDSLSDTLLVNAGAWLSASAYYYIDDVSAYDITANAGKDTTMCIDKDTVLLGTHNLSFCRYQWSPVTGIDNANTAKPKAFPTVTTTYVLTVSFADTVYTGTAIDTIYSSITTDTVVVLVKDCNGINEKEIKWEIKIYPNPATNRLIIETYNSNERQKFEILNIVGQTLYRGIIEKKSTINISAMDKGIYFIKLYDDKMIEVKRFVKK
ncbi:MAG: T9SS type A sorting domain-containing protein [Bacteroidales bacterium]|nr:T9SS type A sorting domain-containing protein [Bacteroidales bacterium]